MKNKFFVLSLRTILSFLVSLCIFGSLLSFSSCTNAVNKDKNGKATSLSNNVKAAKEYYVSPKGSNSNIGTKASPFATIAYAKLAVNKFKSAINDNMAIILMDGNHFLNETLDFLPSDTMPDDKVLTIKADTGAKPVINGGELVTNWSKTSLNGKQVYKVKIKDVTNVRSFYVDSKPMHLASVNQEKGKRLNWDWKTGSKMKAIELPNIDLKKIVNVKQTEVSMDCQWKIFICKIDTITGQNLNMLQPYFDYYVTPASVGRLDPDGYWFPNPRYPLYLQNDISFISTPGDFCYNEKDQFLYYYPKNGEDPNKKECIISKLDTCIRINGDPAYKNIKNITFEDVTFGYGAFDLIHKQGLGIVQSQEYYSGVTTALGSEDRNSVQNVPSNYFEGNITINYAENINFSNCTFINMAKAAIHYNVGVSNCVVKGCFFKDLGDSAVVVGNGHAMLDVGVKVTKNITIDNNLIRSVGNINRSAPGICIYFSRDNKVTHNDIYETTNTGISVGWGWYISRDGDYSQNNVIEYNKLGNFNTQMRDGGGIYTLGKSPNSFVRYNYVYDHGAPFGALYHDEGSTGYTTEFNVVNVKEDPIDKGIAWLFLNGFDNGKGGMTVYNITVKNNYHNIEHIDNRGDPSSVVVKDNTLIKDNNWPAQAQQIMDGAGLSQEYKKLLDKIK